jgi:TPR repeat protein
LVSNISLVVRREEAAMLGRITIGLVLALLAALPATAQDLQKGHEAYIRGDYAAALKQWWPLARRGIPLAQNNLGILYEKSQGVPRDYKKAVAWYRKAAVQGYGLAQNNLGVMYQKGRGVPQDNKVAVAWYRLAAGQDVPLALFNLGYMYSEGLGVPRDFGKAAELFQRAAKKGLAKAQHNLGFLYGRGLGVPQDHAEAVMWYRKAAEQGHSRAQHNLGFLHEKGHGVPQDHGSAAIWYRRAAEQGNRFSQYNLGLLYAKGLGVPRDYATAATWLRKAAAQGLPQAKRSLAKLRRQGLLPAPDAVTSRPGPPAATDNAPPKSPSPQTVPPSVTSGEKKVVYAYHDWLVIREAKGDISSCSANSSPSRYATAAGSTAQAWVVVGHVPERGLFNVTRISFGEDLQVGSKAELSIKGAVHYLPAHGKDSYYFSGTDNARLIQGMMSGLKMTLRYAVMNGTRKKRVYSLKGFTAAYNRAPKPSPGPSKKRSSKKPALTGLGSGFFVTSRGDVLTNHHVVDGCKGVIIGKELATVIAKDKASDLALLRTAIKPESVPKFRGGRGIRLGEDIIVAGFPLRIILGSGLSITKGTVSRLKGVGGNRRTIQITAPVQPGNSGGPLLDTSGNITGVVVSILSAVKIAKLTGTLPQNINFAVNAATARAFLDSEYVAYQVAKSDKLKSTADIAEEARKYTVLVQCWK